MPHEFTTAELEAYLDELLPAEVAATIEQALRDDDALQEQLAQINGRRDAGIHSLGDIWRRNRLSCPTREQLGSYLLGVLDGEAADYVVFHLEAVHCRCCRANIEDLRALHDAAVDEDSDTRQRKYFQSSAGYLSDG